MLRGFNNKPEPRFRVTSSARLETGRAVTWYNETTSGAFYTALRTLTQPRQHWIHLLLNTRLRLVSI